MARSISGNRLLIAVLVLIVGACMLLQTGTASAAETGYFDGQYEGTAYGYRSDVTVRITIANHELSDIEVVSQAEDAAYWKKAVKILAAIKEAKSLEVDTISGATVSSQAILDASKAALDQALSDPKSPFISGDGSAESPYTIATAAKLAQFAETVDAGETYEGKIVVLGSDMDLSEAGKWNPIGAEEESAANVFNGTFDGNGHTVKGMTVSGKYAAASSLGLFSSLGEKAQILNLNVQDAKIKVRGADALRAGLIAGNAAGGTVIDSCAVAGSVDALSNGNNPVYGGGLIGCVGEKGVITNNWADVSVEAASAGGESPAFGGGLFAAAADDCVTVNNAAFGEVYASAPGSAGSGAVAGGLSAVQGGFVWNNYASGEVSSVSGNTPNTWIGALVGQATVGGMEKNSEGKYQYPAQGAMRANNYFAQETALSASKAGKAEAIEARAAGTGTGDCDTLFAGTKVSAAQMQAGDFADTMNDGLVDAAKLMKAYGIEGIGLRTWDAAEGCAIPAGQVWKGNVSEETTSIFASGKGTKKNPYVIMTADQLLGFAKSVNAGDDYAKAYIALGADIDLAGVEWTVINGSFNGSFDGAGHTVSGLTIGSADAPYEVASGQANVVGFISRLAEDAVVKNLHMKNANINITSGAGLQAGILAGYAGGARIDGCSAEGAIKASCSKGNAFVGGLAGRSDGGVIVNSWTDAAVVCEDTAAWVETGAITGMNNGGLIANSYSIGDLQAVTGPDNGGYAMGSLITGYQGGDVVNCYAAGNLETNAKTEYSGILSGWMRGAARTYNCWYSRDARVTYAGEIQDPAVLIGVWPTPYTDEEGLFYIGGLTDGLNEYRSNNPKALADGLNAGLAECPIDLEQYGLGLKDMKQWTISGNTVTLSGETAEYSYMQPACEVVPQKEITYQPGIWYGRSEDKSTVVALTVSENKVKSVEIIEGSASGDAYNEAFEKAKEKAQYGDTSGYGEADPAMFAGGSGTKEDPYQIANEVQLRYLAQSINEDVDWEGVWFKQTDNIKLTMGDWTPIGWGIMAEIKASQAIYAQYPFRGNFDGGDYTISGLTIGSKDQPSEDPRVSLAAGLFGIVEGEEQTNDTPQDPQTRYVELNNIHLENVSIHVKAPFDSYVGALAGDPEMGFRATDCSAEGTVESAAEGSIYLGGLMGAPLRGLIQNCWTNVDSNAKAGATAYAGGLCGMDNRVTTVNCFTVGSVNADGKSIYAGGLSGDFAGFRYNCYTAAKVSAAAETDYIGAVNGMLAGIGAESNVYYSDKADLTVAGKAVSVTGTGQSSGTQAQNKSEAKADMGQDLIDTLNANRETAYAGLKDLYDNFHEINHHGHGMYYADETNQSLYAWGYNGMKIVAFKDQAATPGAEELAVKAKSVVGVKAKAKKGKKAQISWKSLGKGYTYEVYRSLKSGKGFKKVATTKKTKVIVKKNKAKKTYYVKVRAYKTVNGKKVSTGFSKTISFKAKK